MIKKYTRTTITLPEWLLFEIKRKALNEKKTIKEIINESLTYYIYRAVENEKTPQPLTSLFGIWGKGDSGTNYLKKVRYDQKEKEREKYLKKLWKKS